MPSPSPVPTFAGFNDAINETQMDQVSPQTILNFSTSKVVEFTKPVLPCHSDRPHNDDYTCLKFWHIDKAVEGSGVLARHGIELSLTILSGGNRCIPLASNFYFDTNSGTLTKIEIKSSGLRPGVDCQRPIKLSYCNCFSGLNKSPESVKTAELADSVRGVLDSLGKPVIFYWRILLKYFRRL